MDVYRKLKEDHRRIDRLFLQLLGEADNEGMTQNSLFEQLRSNLEAHAQAEEAIFYPILEDTEEGHEKSLEALEEHQLVRHMVSELEDLSKDDERWRAKLKVLSEIVQHHVREEENELFTQAKDILDSDQAEEVGSAIEEEEEMILGQASGAGV